MNEQKRCRWCNTQNPLYVDYHDNEWCVPRFDDAYLYEMLILESFQAGLSWECVLNKRESFRKAYDGFDINKVVLYDENKINELYENKNIIRNKRKIVSSVQNSRIFKSIFEEYGSFYRYLQTFIPAFPIFETDKTQNALSDAISKDLKKRGMTFVGSVVVYAYLQAVGIIRSHEKDCYLYEEPSALHITNGDCFNTYFLAHHGGRAVPFREAMMDGEATQEIFSDAFIALRAKALGIGSEEYRAKMLLPDLLAQQSFEKLCLWFGKDTFCQLNLLTLLAYLEQIGYRGGITLNYIDDETLKTLEENIPVPLGRYQALYEEILIQKRRPKDVGALNGKAIDLYFDYLSPDGLLARTVKENIHLCKTALICLLLKISKDYGLSDLQAEKLINTHASPKK